jgi:fructokinase
MAEGDKLERVACKIFETDMPGDTITEMVKYINDFSGTNAFDSMGIASFGPICIDKTSDKYGFVTTTPKVKWQNFDLVGSLEKHLTKKSSTFATTFDTDCNILAAFEFQQSLNSSTPLKESLCYITVGTGIGIGLIVNGKCVHGMMHPEGGHAMVLRHKDDTFEGVC